MGLKAAAARQMPRLTQVAVVEGALALAAATVDLALLLLPIRSLIQIA